MQRRGTAIADARCEVFTLHAARLIVTAADRRALEAAVAAATGYGCSIIGCDCEAGLEQLLPAPQTPDGRAGAALLLFQRSEQKLAQAVQNRTGQCLMTAPTVAVFDGLAEASSHRFNLGRWVRFFGDGFERFERRFGRRGCVVPVMSGEFFCEATAGRVEALGGAAVLVQGRAAEATLHAARRAVDALADRPGVITPFPGGICAAGSKVGSRTGKLIASTNEPYCPTLRDRHELQTALPEEVGCVYEIVINALSESALKQAVAMAIDQAAGAGIAALTTAQYGGDLADRHWPLRELLNENNTPD